MKESVKIKFIPLGDNGFHLAVKVKINNTDALMVVDTGATQTVVSAEFAEKMNLSRKEIQDKSTSLGIGTDKLSPMLTFIDKLKIGKIKLEKLTFIVLPMEHINQTYTMLGNKAVDGIIGNDLLILLKSLINLEEKEIVLKYENH